MKILVGKNKPTIRKMFEIYNDFIVESVKKFKKSGNVFRQNFRKCNKGYIPNLNNHIIIRWGWGGSTPEGSYVEYNNPKAILRASNKRVARRFMGEAGVPIPKTWESIYNVPTHSGPLGCTDLIHETICRPDKHQSGKDLYKVKTMGGLYRAAHLHNCTYFSRYYPKTKEFRAHVAHGKILVMQEKVGATQDNVIWNHARTGCEFIPVKWSDYRMDVCKASIAAVKALGLDFGAVDIMADPTDDQPSCVVCEVNTAPSMINGDYVMEKYHMYFKWLDRKPNERREHWDTSGFEKAKSFAWKNWQLRDECKPSERGE